jgi:dTDP-4-dehydrorhamnose reductase
MHLILMRNKMERILVIGASGMLGNRMLSAWANDHEVSGTFNKHTIDSPNSYPLDVTQKQEVERLLNRIKPDLIVDTHGITSVDYCESHKAEATLINVEGTKNLAAAAKALGSKYILMSTDAVFDGQKNVGYTELDEPHPIIHYGMTKLLAEEAVADADLDYLVARTSTLFGKGGSRTPPSFVNWVIEQLTAKQRIDVVTDQYGNPTYTDNLCEFVLNLHQRGATGLFHVAGKDTLSRFELANKIAEVFELDGSLISPITSAALGQRVKKPLRTGLDISKAEKAASMAGIGIDSALNAFKRTY